MAFSNRKEVDDKYKWDLTKIYETEEEFFKDFNKLEEMISKVREFKGRITESAQTLLDFYEQDIALDRLAGKVMIYASLKRDENISDSHSQELMGRVDNLVAKIGEETSFVTCELLSVDYSLIEKYYEELPELKKYELDLKRTFRFKNHILSEKEEKLYASFSNVFANSEQTYSLLTDADMNFGTIKDENGNDVTLTDSNYSIYIKSNDRRVRNEAFNLMFDTYSKFRNTIANTLKGEVMVNSITAKVKGYKSAIESALYATNIDKDVYDNLVNTVNDNLSVIYKYYDLKKEILKLDELHLYDVYAPLVGNLNKKYPYEDSKKLVVDALNVLGEDYLSNINKAFDERWIDVYNTPSKRSGAYSWGSYDTNPYILLNYEDSFNDVSTLIHELGHSMHSYYSHKNNDYIYGHYKIFVAEVASTVNELLLVKHLLSITNNKEEKLYLLNSLLELFRTTIYRQTMFAEFEEKIYAEYESGNILTNELLSNIYYDLNKKYFGDGVVVDEKIKYEWERIPHFYMNFYVYQYATGLSAACYIVNNILSGKEDAVKNYLEFLKTGGSMESLDELKVAGVDMKDKEVIKSALNMFSETIDEFKKIYNEVGD